MLRRWLPPAALAALLHAALFAAAGRVHAPAGPLTAANTTVEEVSLDLTPDVTQGPLAPVSQVAAMKPPEGHEAPRALGRGARVAAHATSPSTAEAPDAHGQSEPAPAASDDGWTFNPSTVAYLTSPGVVARSVRGIVSEDAAQAAPASAGHLAEALDERDVQLGAGRGGPVLTALENVTRGADIPEGWATFDVAIDTAGHVSVALGDVSGEHGAWARVASTAAAAVDTTHVRIPPGARGWRVVLRVEAKVQYPDGRRPKDLGTHFEATAGKLSSTSMVMEKTPGFTIATQGKVCGIGLSMHLPLPTIAGGCDPENAGMPAVRIVSGRILSEGRL